MPFTVKDFPGGYRPDWTALVTPFDPQGGIDWKGLEKNLDFQLSYGMNPLSAGTTGESPALEYSEHNILNAWVHAHCRGRSFPMAGTGANSTKEALELTMRATTCGIPAVLLVDCYYNGPSSRELREYYYRVIAKKFPDTAVVPYVIPGRTGTALGVEDLFLLHQECPNVVAVKEATADLARMAATRRQLGDSFFILSGDDDKTYKMMWTHDIRADGVISVASNVAPGAVAEMTKAVSDGRLDRANELNDALAPLFGVVTVNTIEDDYHGFSGVKQKYRNPLPCKTMMNGLGMPAGFCRPPLGRMSRKGVEAVRNAVKTVWVRNPEILRPIKDFYGIDVEERIREDRFWALWQD